MTSYETMMKILHEKDFALLENWIADDFLNIYEMEMKGREDFINMVKSGLTKYDAKDLFAEEKCLFENKDVMNYSRLETQDNGIYQVIGTYLINKEGKAWRGIEKGTKIEDVK
tara:strand:- start:114 stop:452 length:339 start_codon:yes stop_codon:yes gene_type:complete